MEKKLSIITINLNNAAGLYKTIESVVNQTFTEYEYIIIDGGSTDGSIEAIKEHQERITFWVSEPDKGIYNAMNKGILKANGEYCLFLNSGDWFADENVIEDFCNLRYEDDVIIGDIYLVNNEDITLLKAVSKEAFGFEHFYSGNCLPHQSSFIKRELFRSYGLYNERFLIASDFEFFVKVLLTKNATYNYFERVVSYYDLTGISSQSEYMKDHNKEREIVFQTYVPLIYKSYKKIYEEKALLLSYQNKYREYMNLKHGRIGFLIRLILFLKRKKKQFT